MTRRWYVLSCTPRKERVIYHQLRDRGYEVIYPYLIVRTRDPNTLKIEPYFPGYLFINVDLSQVAPSTFQWMPLTAGLINFAGKPAPVPETMVRAIWRGLHNANCTLLGMPVEFEPDEAASLPGEAEMEYEVDLRVAGADRSRGLLKFLQGMVLASEHAPEV